MSTLMKKHEFSHPYYDDNINDWAKYRLVLEGGRKFVEQYLKMYSTKEDPVDFQNRKEITYCPSHAEAALMDIRNNIFQRLQDITRDTNIPSFNNCINGENNGVDMQGSTLNSFMGRTVLTELLFLGRVGVYVDRSPLYDAKLPKQDRLKYHPYLYVVTAEQMLSWAYDDENQLKTLLIEYSEEKAENDYGLVTKVETRYKLFSREDDGVSVTIFDDLMKPIDDTILLNLSRIPIVIIDTSRPLLRNIADYQIALLNMESSDVSYSIRSNFTFYVEQFDPRMDNFGRGAVIDSDGEVDDTTAKDLSIRTGHTVGRRYPLGAEAPSFISPPSEPLDASMKKENAICNDIRKLINLNISLLEPVRASAESKKMDYRGLESGLSCIGLELEYLEREIISRWAEYEGITDLKAMIQYPSNYDPKSDSERLIEAKEYMDLAEKSISETYKREMTKRGIYIILSSKVDKETLLQIFDEVDNNPAVLSDVKKILETHQEGLVSDALAAKLLGYPEGDIKIAAQDHAERAARIVTAQKSAADKARGAGDLDDDANSDKVIKQKVYDLSQDTDDGKRGEGK